MLTIHNVMGVFSSGSPHGEDFRIALEEIARLHCLTVSIPRPYLEEAPTDASKRENLDWYSEKWANEILPDQSEQIAGRFERDIRYISELEVDLEKYKINNVSHFYALFVFADLCYSSGIDPKNVADSVNDFFQKLRNSTDEKDEVWNYRKSMQANTTTKTKAYELRPFNRVSMLFPTSYLKK